MTASVRLERPVPARAFWQAVRNCQGPGGDRSTETRWNGFTTVMDSECNFWNRWNGFETTTVGPSDR